MFEFIIKKFPILHLRVWRSNKTPLPTSKRSFGGISSYHQRKGVPERSMAMAGTSIFVNEFLVLFIFWVISLVIYFGFRSLCNYYIQSMGSLDIGAGECWYIPCGYWQPHTAYTSEIIFNTVWNNNVVFAYSVTINFSELFNLPIAALWTAVLGEWDRSEQSGAYVPVERIILHGRYHHYQHDIGNWSM